jgi:fatty-acyl-CoA synthase
MKAEGGRMQLTLSYLKSGGEVPLLERTIPAHFQDIARRFRDHEAVVAVDQSRRLTYGQLAQEVDILARSLMALGYDKGERIGIWSTNNLEWVLIQMACARIGVILVNINPAYRLPELAYALRQSELQCLFTIPAFRSSDYLAMLAELLPELKQPAGTGLGNTGLPHLHRVICYNPRGCASAKDALPGLLSWTDLLDRADNISQTELEFRCHSLHPDEVINIQYTSGTTGHPKAVMLTHHSILNNAWFSARIMGFSEADRLCVAVPFYHCFGTVLATLLCLSCGACLVIACDHFEPGRVLAAIEQEHCTAIHGVPTMFIAALEHENFQTTGISSLRTGIMAGAPCPPPLMKRVMSDMHCPEIIIGYGQTEASPLTHLTRRDDSFAQRILTVGRNLPHQEAKIIEVATGETVAVGQVGEICFRGYHVMKGYYKDPEATALAIDNQGWLHSGDLGTMDGLGYVAITGRLKDMIIRGGENIYPAEIEEVLFTHPALVQVAVIGVPDDYWGEEIMAWVSVHSGGEPPSCQELQDYCRDKLAHYKIPKYIWQVQEFPLTVTGKIQKFKMREQAIAQLQQNKEHS